MNKNLIIIPSRNRVQNVNRVVDAIKNTATMSDIMIALDNDNDDIYPRIDGVIYKVGPRLRMNGTLNALSSRYVDKYETITFMGDDHLPRTYGWDEKIYAPILIRGYGVSYGNDLFQKQALPTAVMISSNIIKILGFMAPPALIHMFMDNFWKRLGEELRCLSYFDDVIIEHMHAYVGKSELDEMYLSVNNAEVGTHDGQRYGEYIEMQFESDIRKIKSILNIA